MLQDFSESTKHLADASVIIVGIGALTDALPKIAALLTILWLAIRIWESDTVRGWTRRPLIGRNGDE
jgi:hypothetical protein